MDEIASKKTIEHYNIGEYGHVPIDRTNRLGASAPGVIMISFRVNLPNTIHTAMKIRCAKRGITLKDLIIESVSRELKTDFDPVEKSVSQKSVKQAPIAKEPDIETQETVPAILPEALEEKSYIMVTNQHGKYVKDYEK